MSLAPDRVKLFSQGPRPQIHLHGYYTYDHMIDMLRHDKQRLLHRVYLNDMTRTAVKTPISTEMLSHDRGGQMCVPRKLDSFEAGNVCQSHVASLSCGCPCRSSSPYWSEFSLPRQWKTDPHSIITLYRSRRAGYWSPLELEASTGESMSQRRDRTEPGPSRLRRDSVRDRLGDGGSSESRNKYEFSSSRVCGNSENEARNIERAKREEKPFFCIIFQPSKEPATTSKTRTQPPSATQPSPPILPTSSPPSPPIPPPAVTGDLTTMAVPSTSPSTTLSFVTLIISSISTQTILTSDETLSSNSTQSTSISETTGVGAVTSGTTSSRETTSGTTSSGTINSGITSSAASPPGTETAGPINPDTPTPTPSSNLGPMLPGLTAGIAVGSAAAFALIMIILFFVLRKRVFPLPRFTTSKRPMSGHSDASLLTPEQNLEIPGGSTQQSATAAFSGHPENVSQKPRPTLSRWFTKMWWIKTSRKKEQDFPQFASERLETTNQSIGPNVFNPQSNPSLSLFSKPQSSSGPSTAARIQTSTAERDSRSRQTNLSGDSSMWGEGKDKRRIVPSFPQLRFGIPEYRLQPRHRDFRQRRGSLSTPHSLSQVRRLHDIISLQTLSSARVIGSWPLLLLFLHLHLHPCAAKHQMSLVQNRCILNRVGIITWSGCMGVRWLD
ncbi:hypothetical protein B0T17DRAFT_299658 [Bombardia bombarda]|uniref:Uncharacterized protein n=1 Tax=Bombardia bombarda TaxID=252184 RepID=A0AA39WUG3_9PEZI|nr:hypothetical protein B0T17DRAFT_299658 [Bombardia bombarda]